MLPTSRHWVPTCTALAVRLLCCLVLYTCLCNASNAAITGTNKHQTLPGGHLPADLLCMPAIPHLRAALAPSQPDRCLKTELSAPFVELACDFEVNGYCSGPTCDYWFGAVTRFQNKRHMSIEEAAADPELSVKVVNTLLDNARAKFILGLDLINLSAMQAGKLDTDHEHHVLGIGLQVSIVLMWHCDETRTRAMRSKEWSKMYRDVVAMKEKLHKFGTQMLCWSSSEYPPRSERCNVMDMTMEVFSMLIAELKRRMRYGTSQCIAAKDEL